MKKDLDYRTQLTKLKSKKPEIVFAACFGAFLGRTIKQTRELGIGAPIYSVYESEDNSVIDTSQGKADGLRYFVSVSSKNVAFRDFRARFLAKYHTEPGTFASNSYDAPLLLGRAFSKCSRDKTCFMHELYSIKNYNGVSGQITINVDGIARKDFILKEVKNGGFHEVNEASLTLGKE